MSESAYWERRPSDGWRNSTLGVNETCEPAPHEAPARAGWWSNCMPGPVSTGATTGHPWSEFVPKGGPGTYPQSLEREQGNCKTEGPDVHISVHITQRKKKVRGAYPSTEHANANVTSPVSCKSNVIPIVEVQSSSTGHWPHVTNTSCTVPDHGFAAKTLPRTIPLATTHQPSFPTDYYSTRPEHENNGAKQFGSLDTSPFQYERGPYSTEWGLGTNVYSYSKNDSGVTEDTNCTALENHPVEWDNGRLGVDYSCDPASAYENLARHLEAGLDMDIESYLEHVKPNMGDVSSVEHVEPDMGDVSSVEHVKPNMGDVSSVDFQLLQRSRSPSSLSTVSSQDFQLLQRSPSLSTVSSQSLSTVRSQSLSTVSSQSSSLYASPQRSDSRQSGSCRSGSPRAHRRQYSSSCSSFSGRMKANPCISVTKSAERASKNPQYVLPSTLSKGGKRPQSSVHKQSSLPSRSRSHSSLTPISQSRNGHLLRKSRNLPQSSLSRSRSHSVRSSRLSMSRSQLHKKGTSRLCEPSVCGKQSPSSKSSRSSPMGSSSSKKACHTPPLRSIERHSRRPASKYSQSRRSRSSQARSSHSSPTRSLTPHKKGRHSSQKQKSPSTSNHPMGLLGSSDKKDTTQRQFGVKVKFNIRDLDDKSLTENIFRVFHRFGLVIHVKIMRSLSWRIALVYFSRLHEQQAAVSSEYLEFCGVKMHVSLLTGNQQIDFDKDDDGSSIFEQENIALDPNSCRTLLITNLPKSMATEKLDMICEKLDNILDFELVKTSGERTISALVEFIDIVSLVKAGKVLSRHFFGIDEIQVCFAERKPSNCVLVDSLPPSLPSAKLMEHFAAYGSVAKMLHDRLRCRALILYKQKQDALLALNQIKLRQEKVFGIWLMLDFASDMCQLNFCQSMQDSGQDVGNFLYV